MFTEIFVSERFFVDLNLGLFLTCVDSKEVSITIDCLQLHSKILMIGSRWSVRTRSDRSGPRTGTVHGPLIANAEEVLFVSFHV